MTTAKAPLWARLAASNIVKLVEEQKSAVPENRLDNDQTEFKIADLITKAYSRRPSTAKSIAQSRRSHADDLYVVKNNQ